MRYIFIIFLLFILCKAKSQNIEIFGIISDSISKSELPYCNVLIKNIYDSTITGVITNEKGEFKIRNLPYQAGMYIITNYFGYNNKKVEFSFKKNLKINVGKINLSIKPIELKEASVENTKQYIEQKFDRKVYNLSDEKTSSAQTVLDLLKNISGVVVDDDGNVRYKGASATFYVDDQPLIYLYPKVEMIPVDNVSKIEIIDASTRGSGSGKGGIINIRMKKVYFNGLSGLLSNNAGTIDFKKFNFINSFANINYKINNLTLFNNSYNSYSAENEDVFSNGSLNYLNNSYSLNSTLNQNKTSDNFNNYTGIIYQPSENTKITLIGRYFHFGIDGFVFSDYLQNTDYNIVSDNYNVKTEVAAKNIAKAGNIYFTHQFDTTGKELSGGVFFQNYLFQNKELNNYNFKYLSNVQIDSLLNNNIYTISEKNEMQADLYYNHPVNENTRWNCGWSGYFNFKQNDDSKIQINNISSIPLDKETLARLQNHNLFWRIGTIYKRWKFDGGLSFQYNKFLVDYKRFNLNSKDTVLKINKDFFDVLPSATINFMVDSLQEIKLTFDRSSSAPYFDQFCDFIDKQNPRNWLSGNSKLSTVNFNNLYLGYSFNKKNWNISADLFYSLTNNELLDVKYPYSDIITLTMPENLAQKSVLGFDFSSWFSINKKLNFNLSSSLFHSEIDASSLKDRINNLDLPTSDLISKNVGYYIKFSTNIKFSQTLSGIFNCNYFSREITFEGYKFDYINSSISITKKLFNNKFLVTFGVNNLLDDLLKHGNYNNYLGFTQTTKEVASRYQRTYFLRMRYIFRQGDRGTKDLKTKD